MNSATWMPASSQLGDEGLQACSLAGDIEAALGGELLAPLGHQAAGVRAMQQRDRQHLRRHRHFEIEGYVQGAHEPRNVVIADMPAVLAKMRRDIVGAGLDREPRRAQGVRMAPSARIPQASRHDRC